MYTIDKSKLVAISKYSVFVILVLQLTLPGFCSPTRLDNDLGFESLTESSFASVVFCIEDAEDKSFNITSVYFNFFGLANPKKISYKAQTPNNYSLNQNSSRSPPLS